MVCMFCVASSPYASEVGVFTLFVMYSSSLCLLSLFHLPPVLRCVWCVHMCVERGHLMRDDFLLGENSKRTLPYLTGRGGEFDEELLRQENSRNLRKALCSRRLAKIRQGSGDNFMVERRLSLLSMRVRRDCVWFFVVFQLSERRFHAFLKSIRL